MQILDIKPVASSGGGMRTIAHFDLQLTPEVRLHGMKLLRNDTGRTITYAPQSGVRRTATFARPLAEKITAAALKSYMEATTANDENQSTA
jgi:hypothetical protein